MKFRASLTNEDEMNIKGGEYFYKKIMLCFLKTEFLGVFLVNFCRWFEWFVLTNVSPGKPLYPCLIGGSQDVSAELHPIKNKTDIAYINLKTCKFYYIFYEMRKFPYWGCDVIARKSSLGIS